MWLKICGITNLEDAQMAAQLGADALGFIFAESPRQVKPQTVKEIIAKLPTHVMKVGVFVNEKNDKVAQLAEYCNLTAIQLHGEERPEDCLALDKYQIIKAFRVKEGLKEEIKPFLKMKCIDKILLDTYVPKKRGGTGKTFAWETVREINWGDVPVIIAGGLTPDNVLEAISIARPFGIDVCSGVEKEPGKKEFTKLQNLMEKMRGITI